MLDTPFSPAGREAVGISPDFEAFRQRACRITGLDLTCYKAPQMQRRLTALLARVQVGSFAEYAALLERDVQRRQEFLDYVTINVSEFFRDGDRFRDLERRVLPELLAAAPARGLSVWSAGCSIGAEPYSLAILLRELGPGRHHQVLATDVDQTILARAQAGTGYSAADVRNVTPERLARWFTADKDGTYGVGLAPRSLVTFKQHDLLRDTYPAGPFDLIACRNVVIYFTDAAKERIYAGYASALRPGGVLFVGGTEAILKPQALSLQVLGPGLYARVGRA
jgi:chemotaxis protein methyltransferase CheR